MSRRDRTRLEDALHLLVLWGFAVAQPLYDLLGRNAEFFVAQDASPADIFLFTGALSLLAPGALVVAEQIAGIVSEGLRRGVHSLFTGTLFCLLALAAAKVMQNPLVSFSIAGSVTMAGVLLLRTRPARAFLGVLVPSIAVFPALFLLGTPVTRLFQVVQPIELTKSPKPSPPIIFVVFDELPLVSLLSREGRIDQERFPNFAALASDGLWFRNATTVATETTQAVPALLTGSYPRAGKLPDSTGHPNNLFTLLGSAYSLRVEESLTRLCPPHMCRERRVPGWIERLRRIGSDVSIVYLHLVTPSRLTKGLPTVEGKWVDFVARRIDDERSISTRGVRRGGLRSDRRALFAKFVSRMGGAPEETLHFLHVLLPHRPWVYLPSGATYRMDSSLTPAERDAANPSMMIEAWQRHLLQTTFADGLVGLLRRSAAYERALVIVTADHGIAFRRSSFRRRGRRIVGSDDGAVLRVPLFVKLPDAGVGGIVDRPVETIDIVPTIASVLGLEPPWEMDGRSLLDSSAGNDRRRFAMDEDARILLQEKSVRFDGSLARQLALFGAGPRELLFTAGPQGRMFGRRESALEGKPAPDLRVVLDDAAIYANVDPESLFVPAYVSGRIDGLTGAPGVAVVVNGIVRAFTRRRPDDGSFAAVVPEGSFRAGANDVGVLIIEDGGKVRRPRDLASPAAYHLRPAGIEGPNGGHHGFGTRLAGRVGRARIRGRTVIIRGWAVDRGAREAARKVLLFDGGRLLAAVSPDFERTDVARSFGIPDGRDLGFRIVVPLDILENATRSGLRTFAISDGSARELGHSEDLFDEPLAEAKRLSRTFRRAGRADEPGPAATPPE